MKAVEKLKQLKLESLRDKYPSVPSYAIPVPKYSDNSANGLTKCVIDYLQLSGWQAERINTMGRMIDNRQRVTDVLGRTKTIGSTKYIPTTGTKGSSDVSATIMGRSVKIEIKYGKDRQSQDQKKYQESIEKSGGIYWIVKTFEDFLKKYEDLLDSIVK